MPLVGLEKVFKAIDEKKENLNDKVHDIFVEGLGAIIEITPTHFKDGGALKNSWFLTEGSPSDATRDANEEGAGSYASLATMPKSVLNKTLYFTNNQPYVNIVEYGGFPNPPKQGTWTGEEYQKLSRGGFSEQAAEGMARTNIDRMRKALND